MPNKASNKEAHLASKSVTTKLQRGHLIVKLFMTTFRIYLRMVKGTT